MRPTFAFSRPRLIALACGVLGLMTLAPTGTMAQTVSAVAQTGKVVEYTVCRSAATFPLDVSTKSPTMVELPAGFDNHLYYDETKWVVERDGNKLYIAPPSDIEEGEELAIRIRASAPVAFEASLHTRAVKTLRGIDDNVLIYHQTDKTRYGKHPEDNPCPSVGLSPTQRLRVRAFARQHVESRTIGVPEIEHVARKGNGVPIELAMYEMDAGNMVLDFNVNNNQHATATEVTEVRVLNSNRDVVKSEIWYWNDEGASSGTNKVAVAAFQDVRGSIYIPDADQQELEPMWVEFRGMRGSTPFMSAMQVGTFRHMTPEEIEQMKREDELRRQREEERLRRAEQAKQVSVSVRVLGGGFWTDDAVAGTETIAGTTMTGVGVRFQKGYFSSLALEIEGVGARTEQARFQDTMWNNTQGEVARSASLFRLKADGVVRLGEKYITAIRLGVGVQGTSYDSSFTAGGMTTEGPGNSIELDGVWSIGAGFDAQLDERWFLGVGATWAGGIYTSARSLDGGIHLGYRWHP